MPLGGHGLGKPTFRRKKRTNSSSSSGPFPPSFEIPLPTQLQASHVHGGCAFAEGGSIDGDAGVVEDGTNNKKEEGGCISSFFWWGKKICSWVGGGVSGFHPPLPTQNPHSYVGPRG